MSTGTYASRSAVLGGGAAKHASLLLREKIKRVASHLLEAAVGDIDVSTAVHGSLGPTVAVTFRQIAKAVYSDMKTLPVEAREELEASYTYDPINGTTAAATHLAMVEVDPATCFVKILKYVVAEDCGRIINPMIVDGQVHGGVAQGIGAALYEEIIYDDDGQLLSAVWSTTSSRPPSKCRRWTSSISKANPRSPADFAAWARAARSARPPRSPTPSPTRSLALGIDISILPMTPERIFRLIRATRPTNRKEIDDERSHRARRACDRRRPRCRRRDFAACSPPPAPQSRSTITPRRPKRRRSSPRSRRRAARPRPIRRTSRTSKQVRRMVGQVKSRLRRPRHPRQQCGPCDQKALQRNARRKNGTSRSIRCLYGAIHCCHAAGPLLEASGRGRIISIIGDSSRVGESGLAIAAAARAGTSRLMKSLAREMGRFGVTCNSIALGLIETAHDRTWVDANRDKLVKLYPIRRLGQPSDVAPMVSLLASDAGAWITGQVISISGGFSMV